MKTTRILPVVVLSAMVVLVTCPSVWAGCGCDHPTPCASPVMPAFASPGDPINLTDDSFADAHTGTMVTLGAYPMQQKKGVAANGSDRIQVEVYKGDVSREQLVLGPQPISTVTDQGDKAAFEKDLFTYLSRPLVLEEGQGHYLFQGYDLAVDAFGVLLIPLDVSQILDATHFLVYVGNLPLEFNAENVLIYNKDGFNLNLFTLDVEGYAKQWGDYYGASSQDNTDPSQSDVLTYWRHDFHEYAEAHAHGGAYATHTVNEDGYLVHEDGTIHVDHDRLVVAVAGVLRDPADPDNPDKYTALSPGAVRDVDIHILQIRTDDPFVWDNLSEEQVDILTRIKKVNTPYTSGFYTVYPSTSSGWDFNLPSTHLRDIFEKFGYDWLSGSSLGSGWTSGGFDFSSLFNRFF